MTSRSNPPTPPTCKIDWYSFTLPCPAGYVGDGIETLSAINQMLQAVFGSSLDPLQPGPLWSITPAKGFYQFRATHEASKLSASWGEVNAHVFVELPGQACSWTREADIFDRVVRQTHARASRVDAAIDITTTTLPYQFLSAGHALRFTESGGNMRSKQGDTIYVGNRKSDRMARVYRYAPPHPRSHLLRVETEFKGKAARALGAVLASDGTLEAVRAAHAVFEWGSEETALDFLQLALFEPDHLTNPVTVNIDGYQRVFSQHLLDTMKRDLLMSFAGLRRPLSRGFEAVERINPRDQHK